MPRIEYYKPEGKTAFIARLTASYGELCSAATAGRILGFRSYQTVYEWLKDNEIPEFDVNGRRRWETAAIGKRLWEARV